MSCFRCAIGLATILCLNVHVAFAQKRPPAATPADIFKKASQAVVTIKTPEAFGSGVLVDQAGVIVTNLHVVQGQERATVTLPNGDAYDDVGVVEFDTRKDLVLLKIKGFKLPTAELGDSDLVAVGDKVYAIGAPKGLELTLSEGLVSGLRDTGDGYRVVQTSAAISSGSSGGGLFDDQGRLVGITSFKFRDGESLNFALPINYVRGMLATTPKMSLAELKTRAVKSSPEPAGVASNEQTAKTGVPRLAPLYRTVQGTLAVVEQSNEMVRISFTDANGYVYGSATVWWVADAKAFKGHGLLDTVCGTYDTRIWKAPVYQEIYVVNDGVIRDRWTHPTKVNCSKGRVDSSVWQEILWYVPAPSK